MSDKSTFGGTVHGGDLQPGMVIAATSSGRTINYIVLDVQRTGEGRMRVRVHILGHIKALTMPIMIHPGSRYTMNFYVIEELPA